jgi:hypothetical protein
MKTPSTLLNPLKSTVFGLALLGLTLAAAPSAQAVGPKAFQFTTSGANTTGSVTTLDHPALNGKPKLNLIIAHRFIVGRDNHQLGLQYNTTVGRWQVRHEDGVAIPLGEGINVLLAPGTKRVSANPLATWDYVAYFPTVAKGNPNALLLATHVINLGGYYAGVLLKDPYSTYFDNNAWSIYTDNIASMKAVAFNIADVTKLKAGGVPISFKFIANVGNISNDLARIDNPLTNNKPNAVVFARHIWQSGNGVYLTKEAGVYYDGSKWGIYTEDASTMPTNAAFVVTVIPQATP